jgi:hypothetical protein
MRFAKQLVIQLSNTIIKKWGYTLFMLHNVHKEERIHEKNTETSSVDMDIVKHYRVLQV